METTLKDYRILYRCFKGPGYWGHFKNTKAYNQQHAQKKLERVQQSHDAKYGVTGEFRVEEGL
jgi:hypothetical protein